MDDPAKSQVILRSLSRHVDAKYEHPDGSSSLLKLLETNLDDLRAIITCRICIRPLYEPYTISCGHTFCYSCLLQWFEKDRTQKTCPDCRAKVIQQPAPAYLVSPVIFLFYKLMLKQYGLGRSGTSHRYSSIGLNSYPKGRRLKSTVAGSEKRRAPSRKTKRQLVKIVGGFSAAALDIHSE